MHYEEIRPPAPLDRVVRCFWFLRAAGPAPAQPVVPDGRIEIVLHLAQPFSLLDRGAPERQAEALISGQLTAPIHLLAEGPADVVGIRFRTAAAGAALRLDLSVLADQVVPLAETTRSLGEELLHAAAAARRGNTRERAERLGWVLRSRLSDVRPDALAEESVRRLTHAGGSAPIHALAGQAGVRVRTLERRVRASVGLAPKMLHRVLRFRRLAAVMDGIPPGGWARAAADAGYYDQAHLIRDFRRFTGTTPAGFISAAPDLAMSLLSRA